MSKKGENIYKRKDGRWDGRYIRLRNIGGKAEYGYIYGKSYAEVKKKLMNAKVAVQLHAETREKSLGTFVRPSSGSVAKNDASANRPRQGHREIQPQPDVCGY